MIDSVYNYLATTYVPKANSRHDAHRQSELKDIYSKIVRKNKLSPTYKIKMSSAQQSNVINMKDTALELKSILATLDSASEDSVFSYRKVYSQEPESAEVEITNYDEDKLPDAFTLHVKQLATPQINTSKSVKSNDAGIHGGKYSFAIEVNDYSHDFSVNLPNHSSNSEIFSEIANTINNAGVGIRAYLSSAREGMCELNIESIRSGSPSGRNSIFSIYDTQTPDSVQTGLAAYYHLNATSQRPGNAIFEINGERQESASNKFNLNQTLKVTLNAPSDDSFLVGYTSDTDKIIAELGHLKDSYNTLVDLSNEANEDSLSQKLNREISGVIKTYRNSLESSGITLDETGHMQLDSFLSLQSAITGDLQALFSEDSDFPARFKAKLNAITLDPMEYVHKKMVTYPNTSKPGISNPYQTSIYSGLLFNYYC